MNISGAVEYIKELFIRYVQPNGVVIFKIAAVVIIAIILLKIFVPVIWENILMGIIKISDKKQKIKKEDE